MRQTQKIAGVAIDRQNREKDDFYPTPPEAINGLLMHQKFDGKIWECAAGEGHMVKALQQHGYDVVATDMFDRGLIECESGVDFLQAKTTKAPNIITNPPFKYLNEFIEKGIELHEEKFALFVRIQALESISRGIIYRKHPPSMVIVSSARISTYRPDYVGKNGGMMAFCWIVWDRKHEGETVLRWF